MKTTTLIGLALLVCSTGCTRLGMDKLATELSKDNATVVMNINTIYGTGKIIRTNPKPGDGVVVSPDGTVTIKPEEKKND